MLEFSSNHNNKLFCDSFTTIRRKSNKYVIGNEYEAYIGKHHLGRVRLIHMSERQPNAQINEIMSRLDVGKPKTYLLTLLKNMYGNYILSEYMLYLTFEYVSRNPNGQLWMVKNYLDRHDINSTLTPEQAELFS